MSNTHTYDDTLVGRVSHPDTGRERTLRLPIQTGSGNASIDWRGKVHGRLVELQLNTDMGKAWLVTMIRDTFKARGMYYRDVV